MHVDSGRIFYKERRLENRKSEETLRRGVGFVPEERDQGIFYNRPVSENLSISTLEKLVKRLFISLRKERQIFDDIKGKLGLSVPSAETEAYYLSGGNKQKVMLGRILAAGCDVYLLDEPTKGIDVGVKSEFYRLMRNLASEGNAIIFSSSDLEEIIEVCDRAVVLYKGCIVKVLQKQELTKMGLVSYADGKADESGIGG
jgi:ABC-type sugar transport system ATPase subunit